MAKKKDEAAAVPQEQPPLSRWKVSGQKRSGLPEATIDAADADAAEAEYRRQYNLGPHAPLVVKPVSA